MSRKLIIAANWKMNKGPAEAAAFLETFLGAAGELAEQADLVIAPNNLSIPTASELINDINPAIGLAAQNVSQNDNGAFTGETSTDMLKELFVNYVIIGHSERRSIYGETNCVINAKIKKALAADITPLFCIGETLEEREGGKLETVLGSQIKEGLEGISDISNVVIAYEPVWAIGTGVTELLNKHKIHINTAVQLLKNFTEQKLQLQSASSMAVLSKEQIQLSFLVNQTSTVHS